MRYKTARTKKKKLKELNFQKEPKVIKEDQREPKRTQRSQTN